jgi:hypothetical protein
VPYGAYERGLLEPPCVVWRPEKSGLIGFTAIEHGETADVHDQLAHEWSHGQGSTARRLRPQRTRREVDRAYRYRRAHGLAMAQSGGDPKSAIGEDQRARAVGLDFDLSLQRA